MRGPKTEASERAHVIEQILDRVLPDWSRDRPDKDKSYSWLRDHSGWRAELRDVDRRSVGDLCCHEAVSSKMSHRILGEDRNGFRWNR